MQIAFPKPLRTGDTVAIVCPASTPRPEPIERAINRLRDLGLQAKNYRDLYTANGYLCGTDAERADELMKAFADPVVKAVLPARGGYGITRMLDRLDYELIRANPKLLIGFSDLTALHRAIQIRAGLVTYHGPNLQDGLGTPDGLSGLAEKFYLSVLFGKANETLVLNQSELEASNYAPLTVHRSGQATGQLVGGNLAVLTSLLGTPYLRGFDNNILLLEDVGEQPYRIDRYLCQLRSSGLLAGVTGVLLGQFNDCEPDTGKPSLSLDQVFASYFNTLGVPCISGVPSGHEGPNVTLPFGSSISIAADEATQEVEIKFPIPSDCS